MKNKEGSYRVGAWHDTYFHCSHFDYTIIQQLYIFIWTTVQYHIFSPLLFYMFDLDISSRVRLFNCWVLCQFHAILNKLVWDYSNCIHIEHLKQLSKWNYWKVFRCTSSMFDIYICIYIQREMNNNLSNLMYRFDQISLLWCTIHWPSKRSLRHWFDNHRYDINRENNCRNWILC